MKYLIIVAVVLIGGAFYWMNQSNKQDAELLKQQQIAHQQKLEQEKAEAIQAKKDAAEQKAQNELARIKENQAKQEVTQAKQKAQIEVAAQKVKEGLIDPDSAKFRNQQGNCGEVNAKNRMGGYTGFSRYVYFPEDKTVIIESDAKDAIFTPQIMDGLWSSKCG